MNLELWQQFGLAGLVVGSMVMTVMLVIKWALNHIDKVYKTHSDERRIQSESHAREREEWRREERIRADRMHASLEQLSRNSDRQAQAFDRLSGALENRKVAD